jgi:hypothetical protein
VSEKRPIALEDRERHGVRLYSPSAARNREAIRDAYCRHMPKVGAALELGSGTGEHVVVLAQSLSGVSFRPGDPDIASRASISAWTAHLGLKNVSAPHALDVCDGGWWERAAYGVNALFSINMIHIAPFAATDGLLRGASKLLPTGGKLFLYGPFSRNGEHAAPANAAFDADLKRRNPEWGVRDLEREILPLAIAYGLELSAVEPMPANNLAFVFTKVASPPPRP